MKLINFIETGYVIDLLKKMNAPLIDNWEASKDWKGLTDKELEVMSIEGTDVPVDDENLKLSEEGYFLYKGKKVVGESSDTLIHSGDAQLSLHAKYIILEEKYETTLLTINHLNLKLEAKKAKIDLLERKNQCLLVELERRHGDTVDSKLPLLMYLIYMFSYMHL